MEIKVTIIHNSELFLLLKFQMNLCLYWRSIFLWEKVNIYVDPFTLEVDSLRIIRFYFSVHNFISLYTSEQIWFPSIDNFYWLWLRRFFHQNHQHHQHQPQQHQHHSAIVLEHQGLYQLGKLFSALKHKLPLFLEFWCKNKVDMEGDDVMDIWSCFNSWC